MLLSSRGGRVFSSLYLVALHVFLFYVLYRAMISSASKHLSIPALVTDS